MVNFDRWVSKTPEPIHLKSATFDYVHSLISQAKTVATAKEGEMGEVIPSHDSFLSLFGSFNASTAYPEKRGFSLSASKRCFGSGCVPLGLVC